MSPSGSGYSESELFRMQQEAEHRVRELQRRARSTVREEHAPPPAEPHTAKGGHPTVSVAQKAPPYETGIERTQQKSFLSLFSSLGLSGDTLLILLLIVLLMESEGNTKLVIALFYLLL